MDFDPRAWNLLAGLALVTGCSGRTIAVDGDSTDSVDGETTLDPDTGPECINVDDCPSGYYCYDGVCQYVPHHDGHIPYPYYDCYSDVECGSLSLCEFNYCEGVYSPPQCDFVLPQLPVLEIPDPGLALAFVDVDADGAKELVVATQTQLHVFESGSMMPTSHARGIESSIVDAMVGGDFDDNPGVDVMLLHDQELDLHASDGLGNLLPAQGSPAPYPLTYGLEAGEFDGLPRTDLLAWGSATTGVIYGNGGAFDLLGGVVTSASTRDFGLSGEGFTLLRDNELLFVDIGGFITGSVFLRGGEPRAQTGMDVFDHAYEVGSSNLDGWTLIDVFDRSTANLTSRWGSLGSVTQMRAGELDGVDDTDELALIRDGELWVHVGGMCLLPVPLDSLATELAFGDHDGDGDDELAVLTAGGLISIVDIE